MHAKQLYNDKDLYANTKRQVFVHIGRRIKHEVCEQIIKFALRCYTKISIYRVLIYNVELVTTEESIKSQAKTISYPFIILHVLAKIYEWEAI